MKSRFRWWLLLLPIVLLAAGGHARAEPAMELEVTLDPQTCEFSASAVLSPPERDFRFLLHESLRVTTATADGRPLPVEQFAGPTGQRQWRIRLAKGGQRVRLDYAGRLSPLDRQRDHRGVLRQMPPMSSPEGSFLSSGSAWYPQAQPMITYRVTLSLPGDQRAVVAGRRVAETLPAGPGARYQATFEFLQPTDGIDLMAGPWVVRERAVARGGANALVLRTYFSPELDATPGLAQGYLDDVQRYIERYSREIGDYPYGEFSVVAGPLPTGFGMPTLTYLGEAVIRLPFIRQTSLGHEVLHNWWGNGVYVDYARGNWAEGLTTFMADYAYKEDESDAAAGEMRLGWLRDAAALPGAEQPALQQFRSRTHGAQAAVGYGKAAMFFVMLRERIGEKAFRQGLRAFWSAQRFRLAAWEDLQAAFERASGQSLAPFFAAWLDHRGAPSVAIESAESRPLGDRHRLGVTVAQGAPPLPLRLPIEITAPGRREVRWIDVATARATADIALDFQPQALRLDPDIRVWRHLDPGSLPPILRRWIGASAPQLLSVATSAEATAAVDAIGLRLFERAPGKLSADGFAAALRGREPILLAGTHAEVDRALASAGLPARPTQFARQGSAQVWTLQHPRDREREHAPLAIVSADDAGALRAVLRGLPHYGSQSWLIFDQAQVSAKGVWPASLPVVPVSRQPSRLR